jgi:hypothetical protein
MRWWQHAWISRLPLSNFRNMRQILRRYILGNETCYSPRKQSCADGFVYSHKHPRDDLPLVPPPTPPRSMHIHRIPIPIVHPRDWKNISTGRRIRYWHTMVSILVYHMCSGRYFGSAPVGIVVIIQYLSRVGNMPVFQFCSGRYR